MSKNKTIFGHVHVHANNTCKYYANGNIFYLRTGYRMPGCAAQKNWTPCFRSSRGRISYPASSDAAVFTSSLCCWSTEWGIWSAMESSSQLQVYVCLKYNLHDDFSLLICVKIYSHLEKVINNNFSFILFDFV